MSVGRLDRISERPGPSEWGEDELLTLAEAARLFWPGGPITVTTLRTAVRQGDLDVVVLAGKFFTTPAGIRAMGRGRRRQGGAREEAKCPGTVP